jgi:putative tRNA adenosine deaminase-associated protein
VTTVAGPGTDDGVDFAVAAFRDDGEWHVEGLTHDHLGDIATLAAALRRFPGAGGALAMVAVDEDFFVLVRVDGADTSVLLSDITAADDWDLAASAVAHLGLPPPDGLDDDLDDDPVPAGRLDLLSDLGMTAMDLGSLLDDPDLYPDEILSDVASQLGFGELFDDVVGFASA